MLITFLVTFIHLLLTSPPDENPSNDWEPELFVEFDGLNDLLVIFSLAASIILSIKFENPDLFSGGFVSNGFVSCSLRLCNFKRIKLKIYYIESK